MNKIVLSIMMLTSLGAMAREPAKPLPEQSIYHLNAALTNQSGRQHGLDVYRGQPVLVTMFYGTCPAVCPLLIESVRSVEGAMDAAGKRQLRVLMISIDPERDTPEALAKIADQRKIDLSRWTLARADAPAVRKIAAVLGIQYRQLPNGEFNHASVITLLDRNGAIVMQSSKLGALDAELIEALRRMTPRVQAE
jgi:protein SCO1/2